MPLLAARGVQPVLHVVLLGHARRARVAHVEAAQHVLHLGRRIRIDQEEAPALGLGRAMRMPDAEAARLAAVVRRVGEQVAGERQQPRLVAEAALAFLEAVAEVFVDQRILCIRWLILEGWRHQHAVHAVASRVAHPDVLALVVFVVTPPFPRCALGPMPIMSTERCDGLW